MELSETTWTDFLVRGMRLGATDIHLYELECSEAVDLLEPEPGSHIDLQLPNGLVRQYSLVTPLCDSRRYVIGVKREVNGRGGSNWLHDNLSLGKLVKVGVNRNAFPLQLNDEPYVICAGGIGITPIYSMYKELKALGKNVHLHYWGAAPETMLFYDELVNDPTVSLYPNIEGEERPRVKDVINQSATNINAYCCGPNPMIEQFEQACSHHGVANAWTEHFGKKTTTETDGSNTKIKLAKTGCDIEVQSGESILEALIRNDIDVMYSCEQGICGACETRYLEGEPIHLDSVKDSSEHDNDKTMMICCSKAGVKPLVLDL